jgi:RecA-family ATPase
MCVSLASMTRFLGANPYPRPVKTAIISREDGPELVKRRLTQLAAGRGLSLQDVNSNILVNTVKQSTSFHIDSQKEREEMAEWLKASHVEFCVIDVLNRLHYQNENSTDDMTKVMLLFDELATLSGAQVCVIHHLGRTGNSRGSTTIEGWADFICKLEQDALDDSLKTVTIKTKSRGAIEPRTVKYWQSDDKEQSRILLVEKVDKQSNYKKTTPPPQANKPYSDDDDD